MNSFSKLLALQKQAAIEAMNATNPTSFMFGTVTSINPLKVQIDQKTILTDDELILTDAVRDHKVEMTVDHMTEEEEQDHFHAFTDVTPGGPTPSQTQTQNVKHTHKYTGKKVFSVHNALKVNETVIVIQMQGGQRFIVLDRVEGRE